MLLSGFITDKNQAPIANAAVELKDEHFETVYQAFSDDAGPVSYTHLERM